MVILGCKEAVVAGQGGIREADRVLCLEPGGGHSGVSYNIKNISYPFVLQWFLSLCFILQLKGGLSYLCFLLPFCIV